MRDYLNEIKLLERENEGIKKQMDALDNHINDLYGMFGDDIFINHKYEVINPERKQYWEDTVMWGSLNNTIKQNNRTINRLRAEYKKSHVDAYLATEMIDIRNRIEVDDFITGIKF